MIADALKGDRIIGMVRLRPGFEADYEGRPPIDAVGCAGRIIEYELLPDGRYTIVLAGVHALSRDQRGPEPAVSAGAGRRRGRGREPRAARMRRCGRAASGWRSCCRWSASSWRQAPADDEQVVDTVAQYLDMPSERRQQLLEMDGPLRRARALIDMLSAR